MQAKNKKLRQTLPLIYLYLTSYSNLVSIVVILTHTHTLWGNLACSRWDYLWSYSVCEGKFSWELQRRWPVLTNTACLPHRLIREKAWCRNEWECCIVKDISVPLHAESSEYCIYGSVKGKVHPEIKKFCHYFLTLV